MARRSIKSKSTALNLEKQKAPYLTTLNFSEPSDTNASSLIMLRTGTQTSWKARAGSNKNTY